MSELSLFGHVEDQITDAVAVAILIVIPATNNTQ